MARTLNLNVRGGELRLWLDSTGRFHVIVTVDWPNDHGSHVVNTRHEIEPGDELYALAEAAHAERNPLSTETLANRIVEAELRAVTR